MSDKYATVCNFREGTKVFSAGTRAYVCDTGKGTPTHRISVRVRAKSRGSRWVTIWVRGQTLHNFRRVTIPPDHPMYCADNSMGDVWLDATRNDTYWRFEPDRLNAIVQGVINDE